VLSEIQALLLTVKQPLVIDSELLDYYCLENEKDWAHTVKK